MKDGLLFNGVDAFADQPTVDQAVKDAASIFANLAEAAATIFDVTAMGTEDTADSFLVVQALLVELCLVHAMVSVGGLSFAMHIRIT